MKHVLLSLVIVCIVHQELSAINRYPMQHQLVNTLNQNNLPAVKLCPWPGHSFFPVAYIIRPDFSDFFNGHKIIKYNSLLRLPQRNVNAIAATISGVDSRAGETPNIFGARADGTAYYVDGVRLRCTDLQTEPTAQPIPGNQKYPF